ncbi:MAG: prepilin-type N-terminal cleavage/methylation domain-containing protein [Deltaproteobacteria bacterium]|nr:prepilin-type N-terminal cleavage/methylation domain-containing protein [Deltaproteobacteria bacterium]
MTKTFNNFCSGQKGYTIIEVMIALVILAVGLLAVGSLMVNAIRSNYLSDSITGAVTLAEDKMEDLLSMEYDNPALQDLFDGNNNDLSVIDSGLVDREELNIDEAGKVDSGHYRRVWNIADNMPVENNKTIKVIVTWDNDNHQISLTSVKRK